MQAREIRHLKQIDAPVQADLQSPGTGAWSIMPAATVDWSFPEEIRGEVTELKARAIERNLSTDSQDLYLLNSQRQLQEAAALFGGDMEMALSCFMLESEAQGYSKFVLCHWRGLRELRQAEFPGIEYKISLPLPSLTGLVLGTGGYAVIGPNESKVGIHFRIGGSALEHWHLLALNEKM